MGIGTCHRAGLRCPHTVGYNFVKIFDTPGCRNPSRDYSRQYQTFEAGEQTAAGDPTEGGAEGVAAPNR